MDIYKPNAEMQRIVNDAAVKLGLAPSQDLQPCEYPPEPCEHIIRPFPCSRIACEDNVAVQVRLSDRSTPWNFWDKAQSRAVAKFILEQLEADKNVVIFSNDAPRALQTLGLDVLSTRKTTRLKIANELNYVEFFLMSQFFGTHVLTGSTFQLWAIFLCHLSDVKVVVLSGSASSSESLGSNQDTQKETRRPGTVDDIEFQRTFEKMSKSHLLFEYLNYDFYP
jgi:hypothetical protein